MDEDLKADILRAAQVYIDTFDYWHLHGEVRPDEQDDSWMEWSDLDAEYKYLADMADDYLTCVTLGIWSAPKVGTFEELADWAFAPLPDTT